jgi:NADH:ubiquinone oxidoreductase subunit 3 (subunit A)
MADFITSPPVVFAIMLAVMALFSVALKAFAIVPKTQAKGFTKPYACGEESNPMIQPDYRQFFPFAFFFTVLHVVALMVTTMPAISQVGSAALLVAFVYILGAVIGLVVLYRK